MKTSASSQSVPPGAPPAAAPRWSLDVRPILADGREPFAAIMAAVDELPRWWVLSLETPFEPRPLHNVLGRHGFLHVTRELAEDHFVTEYWRAWESPEEDFPKPPPRAFGEPEGAPRAEATITLDVRGLQPPEPMERTLAALDELPPGRALVQINSRVPAFLLPHLDEQGWEYRIGEDERGVLVTIWRPE